MGERRSHDSGRRQRTRGSGWRSPPALLLALALAAAVVPGVVACGPSGDGPPRIVLDESACARCRMLISAPTYAAAYRVGSSGEVKVFDDIGCMLAAHRLEDDPGDLEVWLNDSASGAWIRGDDGAVFVQAPGIRTPMGSGIVAYQDRETAERASREEGGVTYGSFEALARDALDRGPR